MQKKTSATQERGLVLLISCYELGHPPFGLALLAGQLDQAGFSTDILDLAVCPLDTAKVARAQFIGISVPMHTALRIGVKAADKIRSINPAAPITFFGLYATLNAKFLLEGTADFVVEGESEAALVDRVKTVLCSSIENGDIRQKGTAAPTRRNSTVWAKPIRTVLPPLSRYAHLEKAGHRLLAGYVEASRGCRHFCRHCPIPPVYEGRFAIVPEEVLLQDIAAQVNQGAAHITFGDPDFLNGPNHSMKIARALHQSFPQVTFDMTTKIEHLLKYQALLPELAALGCLFIVSAVESLSDTVLGHLHKGHTHADILKTFEIVQAQGITLRPSLVPFTPWSTLQDYMDLFDFAEQYSLIDAIDPIQYTIRLLVPPGSLLLSEPAMTPYLEPLVQEKFIYPWTHPDSRMDRLQVAVSDIVEKQGEEGIEATFYKIKSCGWAMQSGIPITSEIRPMPLPQGSKPPLPRLTEPWFCCAEPTSHQMASFS